MTRERGCGREFDSLIFWTVNNRRFRFALYFLIWISSTHSYVLFALGPCAIFERMIGDVRGMSMGMDIAMKVCKWKYV